MCNFKPVDAEGMCDNIGNGGNEDGSIKKRTLLAGAFVAVLGGGLAFDAYAPDNYNEAVARIADDRIEETVDRESPVDHPIKLVEYHARGVARSMAAIHGGKWRVQIDHEHRFVAISQDIIT